MISEKLAEALSDQVNAEYASAYLYLAMSAAADKMGLKGAANWLLVQTKEEMAHGTHMFEYIMERGASPVFYAIEQPQSAFENAREIFEKVLEHEKIVTQRINSLATIALQESDHAGYQFMLWYVNEQVEEESNATQIIDKLRMIGDNIGLVLALDNELAARVFVNPFPAKAN